MSPLTSYRGCKPTRLVCCISFPHTVSVERAQGWLGQLTSRYELIYSDFCFVFISVMIRDDPGRDIIFGVEVCDGRPPTSRHVTATPPPCMVPDSARKTSFCWSLVSTGSGRTITSATTVQDEDWSDGTLSGLRNCVVASGTRGHWCGLAAAVICVSLH